jgi:hypothetical protein
LMQSADAEGYPFGEALKLLILTGQRRSDDDARSGFQRVLGRRSASQISL